MFSVAEHFNFQNQHISSGVKLLLSRVIKILFKKGSMNYFILNRQEFPRDVVSDLCLMVTVILALKGFSG